jgi:uncharacterized protein
VEFLQQAAGPKTLRWPFALVRKRSLLKGLQRRLYKIEQKVNLGAPPAKRTWLPEPERRSMRIIGLISDTHGLLRPEALRALEGSELIIHAGDVGNPKILEELRRLAPVTAVKGNIDTATWSAGLPETAVAEVGSDLIYVLHDVKALDLNPKTARIAMVVSGHSHKPSLAERDGVLYVNPGSAGPRRFDLPVTVARVHISGKPWRVDFEELFANKRS